MVEGVNMTAHVSIRTNCKEAGKEGLGIAARTETHHHRQIHLYCNVPVAIRVWSEVT